MSLYPRKLICRRCGKDGHVAQGDSTEPQKPAGHNCRVAIGQADGPFSPPARHQRSLNPDFSLCGVRRATGALFAAQTSRVTCPDCQERQGAARKRAAIKLASTP